MRFSVSKVGQADIPRPYTDEYLISNIALQPTWCSNLDMDEMQLETPVQGTVWKVVAKVGQTVQVGETVLIIESMKMEIPIESPRTGIVRKLLITEGDQVEQDSVVAILEVV